MKLRDRIHTHVAEWLDWEWPKRKGARLRPEMRCFTEEFRTWPQIYRVKSGAFHIRAPHQVPHADSLNLIAWACMLLATAAVGWVYVHVGVITAAGSAVLLAPVLLLYSIGMRRLEIVVMPDGWVGQPLIDGRVKGWVNFRQDPNFKIYVRSHGQAGATDAANRELQSFLEEIKRRRSGREGAAPMFLPSPTGNAHSEAMELFIVRGPQMAEEYRIAEFGPTREAYMLGAAIMVAIDRQKKDLVPRRTRPNDR